MATGEALLVVEIRQERVTTGISRGERPELLLNIKTSGSAQDAPQQRMIWSQMPNTAEIEKPCSVQNYLYIFPALIPLFVDY